MQIELVNRQKAAEILGLQVQTLAAWAMSAKHLPLVKVGRSVRYKMADLESFIEKQTIAAS